MGHEAHITLLLIKRSTSQSCHRVLKKKWRREGRKPRHQFSWNIKLCQPLCCHYSAILKVQDGIHMEKIITTNEIKRKCRRIPKASNPLNGFNIITLLVVRFLLWWLLIAGCHCDGLCDFYFGFDIPQTHAQKKHTHTKQNKNHNEDLVLPLGFPRNK